VDAYRTVATNMGLFDNPPRARSLLMLDASDGRRAGAAAANLAGVIAGSGRRVLLLDANAAAGGATSVLSLDGKPGYGELLAHFRGAELNGNLGRLKVEHAEDFAVLPRGTGGGQAMLDVDSAQRLLRALSEDVDLILVAAAPIERSPAALVWSRVTDGAVLVVDDKRTTEDRVSDTLRTLRFSGAHVLGTVLGRQSAGRSRKAQRQPVAG
jgi:Mrp family chromosome partitioning ATPase